MEVGVDESNAMLK